MNHMQRREQLRGIALTIIEEYFGDLQVFADSICLKSGD